MIGNIAKQIIGQAVEKYKSLSEEEKELIKKEGEAREIYNDIRAKLIELDWKGLSKYDENLSLLVRIVSDYHFREALARNSEELAKLGEKLKQLGENVAKGHAIAGGIVASLVAFGVVSMGLGTVIGGLVALGSSLIQPAKMISMSGERMDDLGRRIDKIRNTRGKFTENIYWKGIELLHSRPKCRALTSSCGKEHLFKATEVDLFNKFTDALIKFYDDFTFEKFKEQYNLQQIQSLKKETQIEQAVVYIPEQKNKNLLLVGVLALGLITTILILQK